MRTHGKHTAPGLARLLLLGLLCSLLVAGCGGRIMRNALPGELEDQAQPMGIPGVRAWGDTYSDLFQERLLRGGKWYIESHADAGASDNKISLLALSGGGADGAFGAGLLHGWSERGDRPEFRVVTGVSTGALIAPFAFLGPGYDEFLKKMYTSITPDSIYILRNIFSILGSDSVADSSPLRRMVAQYVTPQVLDAVTREYRKGRFLLIATTNLDAKRSMVWDMGAIASSNHPHALELFRKVMVASASVPVVFNPEYIQVHAEGREYDEMHVDGGTVSQFFIYGPMVDIHKLLQQIPNKHLPQRELFVVVNNRLESPYKAVSPRLSSIAGTAVSSLIRGQDVGEIYKAFAYAKRDGIGFNLVSIPLENYPERSEEFDPAAMRILFDTGQAMGKAGGFWLDAPPGYVE